MYTVVVSFADSGKRDGIRQEQFVTNRENVIADLDAAIDAGAVAVYIVKKEGE